jgi:hypothetical protein
MKYSRAGDVVKSIICFGVTACILFAAMWAFLPWQLTTSFVADRIPQSVRQGLPPGSREPLMRLTGEVAGQIEQVCWIAFGATVAIALIWLFYALFTRVYKPGMARGKMPVWWLLFLLSAAIVLAIAWDGFIGNYLQTGLRDDLIHDFRLYLSGCIWLYCLFVFFLVTSIAVPPVMRPGSPGGTTVGHISDIIWGW